MRKLYASVPGCSNIESITVSESHSASTATASIFCKDISVGIGDSVSIDLGYDDEHNVVFTGYVKMIEHRIPNDTYAITCNDAMVRAIDYFVAPDNPEDSYKRSNIALEDIVGDLMAMAGLSSYSYQPTMYTLGVNGTEVEIKLTSAFDFSKAMADLVAWNLWADKNGTIQFRNRKPYVMTGTSGQPGDVADSPIAGYSITDVGSNRNILDFNYRVSEKDLRNRVVVWGAEGVYASASAISPYLPSDFYKTILFSHYAIDENSEAQATASYNLALFNRLTRQASASVVGRPSLEARKVVAVNEVYTGINENMYIFSCEHLWNKEGYTVSMELRS